MWRLIIEYIIIPRVPRTARPLSESDLKIMFPRTYQYLDSYRSELESRSIHKLWGKDNSFYAVYGIGAYTFTPYKVV